MAYQWQHIPTDTIICFFIMIEDRANLNVTSQLMAKKKCWIIGYNGDIDQIKLNESNLVVEEIVKSLFNPR